MDQINAIEFRHITKEFGNIVANNDINMKIKKGSIHAIIGENGAGKSTLMSILFGIYQPTRGQIFINNNEVFINNPNDANKLGIGMVHQHFKLVDIYNNLENIILGQEIINSKTRVLDNKAAIQKISKIQNEYNLHFDLKQKTYKANVGTQQKIEIMKMLYKEAEILIFDEPTAVLTEQEIVGLLETFKYFKSKGKTIIFISHKLKEVLSVADSATVIRHGKVVENYDNLKNVTITQLSADMVGKTVELPTNISKAKKEKVLLEFDNVFAKGNKNVSNISFKVHAGEILAIAGVEGNGQEEIEFLASGMLNPKSGKIIKYDYNENNELIKTHYLSKNSANKMKKIKLSYIPGDRHKYGLVLDFNMMDNSIIRRLSDKKISWKKIWIFDKNKKKFNNEIIKKYDVRGAREGWSNARALSGGNQQKAIVGREMLTEHDVLVVVQPTRGLDVGAIKQIHQNIIEEKKKNKAVLLISYELDEILSLADTIVVVNKGEIMDIQPKEKIERETIGLLMAGVKPKSKNIVEKV